MRNVLFFFLLIPYISRTQCSIVVISDSPLSYEQYIELRETVPFRLEKKIKLLFQQIDGIKQPAFDVLKDEFYQSSKSNIKVDKNGVIKSIIENGSNKYKVYATNDHTYQAISKFTHCNTESKETWDLVKLILERKEYKNYECIYIADLTNKIDNKINLDDFKVEGWKEFYNPCETILLKPSGDIENSYFQWKYQEENNFTNCNQISFNPQKSRVIEFRQCLDSYCGNPKSYNITIGQNSNRELIFPMSELNAEDETNDNDYKIYGQKDDEGVFFLYRNGISTDFYIAINKDNNIDSAILVIKGLSECAGEQICSFMYTRQKSINKRVKLLNSEIQGLDQTKYDAFIIPRQDLEEGITFSDDLKGKCIENHIQYVDVSYQIMLTTFDCSRKIYDSKKLKIRFSACP